jgi:hypothetical protein
LRAHFQALAGAHAALEAELANRALFAELDAPARKLSLYGEAGVLALDLHARVSTDRAAYDARLAAAAAIPWRVGENTPFLAAGALLLTDAAPKPARVFQDFFAAVALLLP